MPLVPSSPVAEGYVISLLRVFFCSLFLFELTVHCERTVENRRGLGLHLTADASLMQLSFFACVLFGIAYILYLS